MAVVNTKSTVITNRDSSPVKNSPTYLTGGALREAVGTVEVANGDGIGSTLRMFEVKSNWRMTDLLLLCDAVTSAAGDIGLYRTAADGGAVVDVDFFASAVSLATAIVNPSQVLYEAAAGPANVANVEKQIWEMLGLSSDPGYAYDVVITLTAAATAAGTVSLKGRYVTGI